MLYTLSLHSAVSVSISIKLENYCPILFANILFITRIQEWDLFLISYFFFFFFKIYLFRAVLGIHRCPGFSWVVESGGYSLVLVHRLLMTMVSAVEKHGL